MLVTHSEMANSGLGNQLFQIASTIGIVRRNGFDFAFPAGRHRRFFRGSLPRCDELALGEVHHQQRFSFYPVDLHADTELRGYYQSEHGPRGPCGRYRAIWQLRDRSLVWPIRREIEIQCPGPVL